MRSCLKNIRCAPSILHLPDGSAPWPRALVALLLCWLLVPPAQARSLIQQALEAGTLDAGTAALYQVYAIRDPQALPAAYREAPESPVCATPVLCAARDFAERMSGRQPERLEKALARRLLEHAYLTPSGRFRVHYDLAGGHRVDGTDEDGNGIPDYVDVAAAVLDSIWVLEVEELGYRPPPSDQGLAGGDEYDVYIAELGGRAYGFTYPEDNSGLTTYSYLELDNNYTDPEYETRGLDALRVAIAHEFFHAIHFAYYRGNEVGWWREASSTWMEDVAYPDVDDYLNYVGHFLDQPERALDSFSLLPNDYHAYGASLFPQFLEQRFERRVIRAIWEELGQRRSGELEHFDSALRKTISTSLGEVVSEFAVWNYFTGPRHRQGYFYQEGEKYRGLQTRPIHTVAGAAVRDSGRVGHLASVYIVLEPQVRPGGILLETELTRGNWSRQLLLVSRDSLKVEPLNRNSARIAGWDQYDEVVLVLVVTDESGFGYPYRVEVEYDPELTDEDIPLAFQLGQNHPNPFIVDVQASTFIPFDLSVRSLDTRLSIFALDGRLVRYFDLKSRGARSHTQVWDGCNEEGELVGSGMYYYVLEADGFRAGRTLAVFRK